MKFFISTYSYKTADDSDVSFLPPMARRKLLLLDKISLCVMQQCYNNYDKKGRLQLVFASQHGEIDRLKKLVNQYTQENEVSPSTFSTSVHNNVVGHFSVLNKITGSYNSLSAEDNTFSAGIIESVLTSKDSDVLFCYCDAVTAETAKGFACIIPSGDFDANVELRNNRLYKIDGDGEVCVF